MLRRAGALAVREVRWVGARRSSGHWRRVSRACIMRTDRVLPSAGSRVGAGPGGAGRAEAWVGWRGGRTGRWLGCGMTESRPARLDASDAAMLHAGAGAT